MKKFRLLYFRFLSFSAGLFDTSSGAQESAFRRAVTAVNDDRSILTKSLVVAEVGRYKNYILKMMMNQLKKIEYVFIFRYPSDDSFKASKTLCDLIQPGVAGVFGPITPATASHVEATSNVLHVPFMQYNFDYIKSRPDFSINVHPHPRLLGKDISFTEHYGPI